MARLGKMTIYVDQTSFGQTITVRTTGKAGTIPLNTVSEDLRQSFRTSAPNAAAFWTDILALVTPSLS